MTQVIASGKVSQHSPCFGANMRYQKPEDLLRLSLMMQGSAEGVGIEDIQGEFRISRRTAERMRDAVMRLFPSAYEVPTSSSRKKWRIPSGTLNHLVDFSADELAALHTAASVLSRDNLLDQSKSVADVIVKIQAALRRDAVVRIAPDLEALIEADGLAMRPGPRPIIHEGVLEYLRDAITCRNEIRIAYTVNGGTQAYEHIIRPYGFLYGNRHYLVAWNTFEEVEDFRLYCLSKIESVHPTGLTFVRDSSFSLKNFAERSFGVFQEEPFMVVWRVKPDSADEAMEYQFHPHQKVEKQADGSLLVSFQAGGALEMCWHLFTWGGAIEVIEPTDLRQQLGEMTKSYPIES